jgi:hypothetical protein
MPIAVYVDRINVDDRVWMLALVLQGKANLREGQLASVSFDRGFWDGQELYMVAQQAPFFIPGRSDLAITQEARQMAVAAYTRSQQGLPVRDAVIAKRSVRIVTGRGKNRREQEKELIVVGITDLDCDTYAQQAPGSRVNSKSFVAGKLNAAVVMEDPEYAKPPEEDRYLTILTCAAMKTPADVLFAYDRFDNRGVIENSGNKQAKQPWKLGAALEKSEAAVYVHTFMVFMLMALMAAFRAHQISEEQAAAQGKETVSFRQACVEAREVSCPRKRTRSRPASGRSSRASIARARGRADRRCEARRSDSRRDSRPTADMCKSGS